MMHKCTPYISFLILMFLTAVPALAEKSPPDGTLTGHGGTVLDLAFSPDGTRLATVADDNKLKIWGLATKKEVANFGGVRGNSNRVRFTPDGKRIVALGTETNVVIFDVASAKALKPIALSSAKGGPTSLDLSPDGKSVAVTGRGWLRLFDLATGALTAEYEVHKSYEVTAVAFSADGKNLATVAGDHTALLIDASTGRVLHAFKLNLNGVAVVLSRDSKTVYAASSDQTVQSFDVETGAAKTLVEKMVPILSLAVSSDGKLLIIGGPGHGPWLVALPEGNLLDPATDSDNWVKSAAISPDGKWLAGGANGGDVYLWKTGH